MAAAINVLQASTMCSSNLVVVVAAVIGVGTLLLFAEEVPTVHQTPWRHRRLNLQTDPLWALQDPKKIYPATDPAVTEVAT